MTFITLTKLFASLVTGMLGIPLGMLPSILLFRDLANGTDSSDKTKRAYERTLWFGMILGWIVVSVICWYLLGMWFSL